MPNSKEQAIEGNRRPALNSPGSTTKGTNEDGVLNLFGHFALLEKPPNILFSLFEPLQDFVRMLSEEGGGHLEMNFGFKPREFLDSA